MREGKSALESHRSSARRRHKSASSCLDGRNREEKIGAGYYCEVRATKSDFVPDTATIWNAGALTETLSISDVTRFVSVENGRSSGFMGFYAES